MKNKINVYSLLVVMFVIAFCNIVSASELCVRNERIEIPFKNGRLQSRIKFIYSSSKFEIKDKLLANGYKIVNNKVSPVDKLLADDSLIEWFRGKKYDNNDIERFMRQLADKLEIHEGDRQELINNMIKRVNGEVAINNTDIHMEFKKGNFDSIEKIGIDFYYSESDKEFYAKKVIINYAITSESEVNEVLEKNLVSIMDIEGIGPNRTVSGSTLESISWPMNDLIYCKIELNREWAQIMAAKYGYPSAHHKALIITTYLKEFEQCGTDKAEETKIFSDLRSLKAEETKIISDLRSLKAAALMYWADNPNTPLTANSNQLTLLTKYMDRTISTTNNSLVTYGDSKWWVGGFISGDKQGVRDKLVDMAAAEGLYGSASATTAPTDVYVGTNPWVWMRAR